MKCLDLVDFFYLSITLCMYVYMSEVTPDSAAGSTPGATGNSATGNSALDPRATGRRLASRPMTHAPSGGGSTRGAGASYARTGATAPRAGSGQRPGRAANVQEHDVASQLMVLQKVRRWHGQIYT